ncbi:MAG: AbrB/MazE/SpoVT family DNA-binding domain-containing protein [Terrisporobacter sp.]
MDIIEQRNLKVSFQKSGSGSTNCRVHLPKKFMDILDITKDDNEITISLIDNKIVIEKKMVVT